jgi:molybdenum transport protein
MDELSALISEIRKMNPVIHIAASGNIDLDNVTAYARSGADQLVTASPYYGKPSEITVQIEPLYDF